MQNKIYLSRSQIEAKLLANCKREDFQSVLKLVEAAREMEDEKARLLLQTALISYRCE
jgi:hypothetical protein